MTNLLPEIILDAIEDSKECIQKTESACLQQTISRETLELFFQSHRQDINRILAAVAASKKKTKTNSVSVEFGHIYTNEFFSEEHASNLITGSTLSTVLQSRGVQVTNILFIDDYNPTEKSKFCLSDYLDFAAENCAKFDFVVYESDMQRIAMAVIQYLQDESLASLDSDSKLKLNTGSMLIDTPSKFSCSLLDASFALLRAHYFNAAVLNVLDRSYKPQQKNVRSIIAQINKSLADGLMQFYT